MTTPLTDLADLAVFIANMVAHVNDSALLLRAAAALDAISRLESVVPDEYAGCSVAGAEDEAAQSIEESNL